MVYALPTFCKRTMLNYGPGLYSSVCVHCQRWVMSLHKWMKVRCSVLFCHICQTATGLRKAHVSDLNSQPGYFILMTQPTRHVIGWKSTEHFRMYVLIQKKSRDDLELWLRHFSNWLLLHPRFMVMPWIKNKKHPHNQYHFGEIRWHLEI